MSVTVNVCPSCSAVGRTKVTCCREPSTEPHLEGSAPMVEQPLQTPTWMVVLRTTPSTLHCNSRVSPGVKELSMCTRHQADARKSFRLGFSTSLVSDMLTVLSGWYVATPMVTPSGVVIGIGSKLPSVPSSLGTVITMLSPAQ